MKWRGLVALMGLFAGLCTLFALVVTVAEACQEHAQAQWPEVTARIQRCGVDPTSSRRRTYYIACRLSYVAGDQEIMTKVYSRSVPSAKRTIWEYPPNQFGRFQAWVDQHPQETPMAVHYDPRNPAKAVLVKTDMPMGGPRTPSNLKLLEIAATSCLVLLAIVRIARPRSA